MTMLVRLSGLCIVVILTGSVAIAVARTIDPHRLYEQRCSGCHTPHAGSFVRQNLVEDRGRLIGRKTGREVRAFLEAGHGNLTLEETKSMVAHLTNIQSARGLFQDKCIICHDRAVVLARTELAIEDGRLVGRYSKRDIAQFLTNHGRLKSDEVARMVDVLKRHLTTMQDE